MIAFTVLKTFLGIFIFCVIGTKAQGKDIFTLLLKVIYFVEANELTIWFDRKIELLGLKFNMKKKKQKSDLILFCKSIYINK
jgi:hypothetical protein